MVVSICQSNYIPWKGYFDMINMSDVFILYDHVQYTKNDWRNRNRIKTKDGLQWITIPVRHCSGQRICDTRISKSNWNVKHWKTLKNVYSKAAEFETYGKIVEDLYLGMDFQLLSDVNRCFIERICQILGIRTEIVSSTTLESLSDRNANLVKVCKDLGAKTYLSGPAAKSYLDTKLFGEHGIEVEWMNYDCYHEYRQLFGKFEHGVSILDLLFNEGAQANKFLRSFDRFGL